MGAESRGHNEVGNRVGRSQALVALCGTATKRGGASGSLCFGEVGFVVVGRGTGLTELNYSSHSIALFR